MGPFSGGIGRFARKKQDAAPVANGGGGGGVSSGDGNVGCAANSGAAVAENANTTTAGNSTGMAPDGGMSGTDPSNAVADTADGMDVDDPSSLNFGSLDDRPATSGSHGFSSIGNMFGGMDEMGDDDNMADMTGMMHLPDGGVDIGNGHAGMDHDGSFENSEFVPSFESRPTTTDGFQFGHQDAMDGGGFGATNHNECMDQDNDTKSVDSKTSVASANAGGGGGGGIGFFAKKRAAALSQESGKKDISASSSTANNAMDSANHANTNSANNNANAHDYASQSVANLSQFDTALLSESKNGDDASFATANGGEDTETLEDRDEVPQSISANADAVDDDLTVGTVNTETLNAAYDVDLDQAINNRFEDGQLKHSPTGNAVTGASNENGTNSDNLEVLANVAGQKSPNRNESCSPTNSADTAHVENVSRPIVAKPSNPAVLTSPRFNNQDIIAADSHKTHARGNATVQSYGSDRRVSRNSPVPKPTFGSNGVASRNSPVPMAASGNNGVASRNSPVPKSVSGSTPLNQHNSPVPNVGKMNSEGPRPYSMVRLGVESVKNTFASNQSPKNNSGTNIVANPGQPTDNSRVLPLPDALVHRNSPVPTDSKANYDISNPHPTVRLGVETENTAFTSAQSPKQFEGANNMPSPVPTQNSRVLPIPAKCTNSAPQAAPTAKSSYFPGATVDEKAITHSVNSIARTIQHQSNVAVNHSYSTSGAESGDKGNFAVPAPRFGIKGPVNLAHSNFRPNMSAVNTRRDSVDESTEIVLPTAIAKTPGNRPRQSIVTPSSHNDTQSGDITGNDNCRINAVTPTPRKGPNPASSTQYDTSPYDRVVPGITPTHNMQKKPKNMSTMHDLAQEASVPPRQLAPGKPSQSVLSPAPVLVRESATPKTSNVTEPNPSQWNTSAFSDSACASDTFDELLAQFQEDLQEGTDYYDKGENDLLKLEVDLSHALAAALRYKGEMMDLLDDIEGVKAMADGMLAEVAE